MSIFSRAIPFFFFFLWFPCFTSRRLQCVLLSSCTHTLIFWRLSKLINNYWAKFLDWSDVWSKNLLSPSCAWSGGQNTFTLSLWYCCILHVSISMGIFPLATEGKEWWGWAVIEKMCIHFVLHNCGFLHQCTGEFLTVLCLLNLIRYYIRHMDFQDTLPAWITSKDARIPNEKQPFRFVCHQNNSNHASLTWPWEECCAQVCCALVTAPLTPTNVRLAKTFSPLASDIGLRSELAWFWVVYLASLTAVAGL